MGTVKRLVQQVKRVLRAMHPRPRAVIGKLSLAVGEVIEGQTPKTVKLSNLLPLEIERQDMGEQLQEAVRHGQVVQLSPDQVDLGDRMVVLVVWCVRDHHLQVLRPVADTIGVFGWFSIGYRLRFVRPKNLNMRAITDPCNSAI